MGDVLKHQKMHDVVKMAVEESDWEFVVLPTTDQEDGFVLCTSAGKSIIAFCLDPQTQFLHLVLSQWVRWRHLPLPPPPDWMIPIDGVTVMSIPPCNIPLTPTGKLPGCDEWIKEITGLAQYYQFFLPEEFSHFTNATKTEE